MIPPNYLHKDSAQARQNPAREDIIPILADEENIAVTTMIEVCVPSA